MQRRQFLATAPLVGAAATLGGLAPSLARAASHSGGGSAQVPAYQRFAVGDMTVTCLGDGSLHIGPDSLIGIEADAYTELMRAQFRDPETYPTSVNAFAIQRGDETILVDAGTADAMGPGLGRLPRSLEAAGIDPASVTRLLATHLHPDHVAGALSGQDAMFPNAELVVSETDRAFWSDEGNFSGAPEMMQNFANLARSVLSAYSDRLVTFSGEEDIGSGITSMPLPGHTPGHSGYMLSSGDDSLLIWADIVHVPPVQFARPDVAIGFDVDPEQAVETRQRTMDMVATDRLQVAGSHIGFPGVVNVEAAEDGYRMIPAVYHYDV
ncbi:beta-lactamase domain containing protein [Roseivivax marinus]|jgi:glyoxylase-like metal-dependent hydrolase (beta-lactamase superfamily II)|uniref:Beta-lactamase domain containing protein n=1 Tax=Roseivivax marinus TaxID=1379903 RepID=W4HLM9_9RHOB|nr:MBL fold metallo-hydrolase [Roseivivax marinus]ETW13644.1 beta-lactamase domain containing protein [Roseivivax marinus]